jgi:hypothetical protein
MVHRFPENASSYYFATRSVAGQGLPGLPCATAHSYSAVARPVHRYGSNPPIMVRWRDTSMRRWCIARSARLACGRSAVLMNIYMSKTPGSVLSSRCYLDYLWSTAGHARRIVRPGMGDRPGPRHVGIGAPPLYSPPRADLLQLAGALQILLKTDRYDRPRTRPRLQRSRVFCCPSSPIRYFP